MPPSMHALLSSPIISFRNSCPIPTPTPDQNIHFVKQRPCLSAVVLTAFETAWTEWGVLCLTVRCTNEGVNA